MERRNALTSRPASPDEAGKTAHAAPGEGLARSFRWHLRGFAAVNIALNAINAATGRPWWAFWPLVATALVLAVHYFFYKATSVDQRWVEERVEELNLKSYDRSHIEDLKVRHGGKGPSPTATGE
jgi:hypothetical protein